MLPETKVKLGQVTHLSDGRFAAAVGIHYIGFSLDPNSDAYIPPVKAKEIMDWLSGSHLVAEFGDQRIEEIKDLCDLLPVSAIQLNNALLPDELKTFHHAIIKCIDLDHYTSDTFLIELAAYAPVVDAFLILSTSGTIADVKVLQFACSTYKIILGLNLDPENIESVIETYRPYGVQLIGGEEERPGVKDFDTLNTLVNMLIPD